MTKEAQAMERVCRHEFWEREASVGTEGLCSLCLQAENARLRDLLSIIVLNAKVGADPFMNGATDAYIVPIDDIEAGRAALSPQPPKQEDNKS